ncbi:MAG: cyclohexanecarboxylate-CoA ligase [Acidimicrobiia bacterium]|nr:cyclohexanecarboxylate-CoA ligase [Acidimicrobiia bacterium]
MTGTLLGWRSLWELVIARADATPDAQFAIDENGQSLTFAELRVAAERAAAGFHTMGVSEDDVISWQLPTWLDSMVLVAALSRLGVVQNPILPIYREREVEFVVKEASAKFLVVPGEWRGFDYGDMASQIASRTPGLESLVVQRGGLPDGDPATLPALPAGASRPFTPGERGDGPVRWLFYTSGTTADPKGAKHTDLTVGTSGYAMVDAFDLGVDDRNALVFPFTHIGGAGWFFAGLISGTPQVIVEAFLPATTIPVLERERVTIAGAGTFFHLAYLEAQRAADHPLFPSVRIFVGGGAAKPPQLHYDVKAQLGGLGVLSGYGLTECPILSMARITDTDEQLANTEGPLTAGIEVLLVALDGTTVGPGEEGEIRVRGPQLFLGYLDSSLDAAAFDKNGYFRTGDLGRIDGDGYVTITGRLKDVIIRKGENISAKEVEDLLFTHPKVADAAVIGLPDLVSGERACAVIVAADPSDAPDLAELFEFLKAAGLMVQKIPEQLEILDVLPRNPTGKVLKHELRAQFADA